MLRTVVEWIDKKKESNDVLQILWKRVLLSEYVHIIICEELLNCYWPMKKFDFLQVLFLIEQNVYSPNFPGDWIVNFPFSKPVARPML